MIPIAPKTNAAETPTTVGSTHRARRGAPLITGCGGAGGYPGGAAMGRGIGGHEAYWVGTESIGSATVPPSRRARVAARARAPALP